MNNEIAKTNATAMPATFNFFDPVQFETMQRVANLFSSSDLVPENYQAKVPAGSSEETAKAIRAKATANCMIAIEISQRIGASPLMVMQNMAVIYGRPSWSSKFLIATVNTCGRFETLKFKFTEKGMLGMVDYVEYAKEWVTTSNGKGYYKNNAINKQFDGKKMMNLECIAYTTEKGSDVVLESSPVTIELAIKEGWFTKNGSKWQSMPKQMLMYRAASWWTSAYAPELSMGMRTVEENQDIIDITDSAVEIVDDLEREKANAGKQVMGFDPGDPNGDNAGTCVVDPGTSEANQQAAEPAPAASPAPAPETSNTSTRQPKF